jgi:cyclopropane fatty-acyl-phospholipid synthase-like methyltransferase
VGLCGCCACCEAFLASASTSIPAAHATPPAPHTGILQQMELQGPPAHYDLICHVLEQAYSRSVAPSSQQLNNYQGFSNNVYGEIKHIFVQDILKSAKLKPHHTFLDMGSGIGNVVLHAAAQTLCDCYGVEIMEIPAQLALKQRDEFMSRMHSYALPCGRITLKQADFLNDPVGVVCV